MFRESEALQCTVSADRADDEKTIHGDSPVREYLEKKDIEAGNAEPALVSESARGQPLQADVDPSDEDFPDGGVRAWLVVIGASFGTFATFGFVNAWGVFQSYYEQTLLSDTDPSTIAWIGSVQYALVFIPGLVTGRLFDMGIFKVPIFVASICLVVCTVLVAQCTEYWQFLLCQGVAVGLAAGVIFGPTLGVVAHWFKKKKGIALGFVALGSSGGGTLFPIAARKLIQEVGFPWTMRILAFILLAALTATNTTLERRLPTKKNAGPFINLTAFRSTAYSFYCAAGFVSFLGLYTVLTYIDISAASVGIDENFSFYLVSIANAGSALGRISAGFLADKFGPLNIMIPATTIAGILTYAWPFAMSQGSYIAVALIYGISSGVFVSMLAAPIFEMGDSYDVGVRLGMYYTILALGALAGPPISGAINTATGGFKDVGYYAGSMVIVSVALLALSRHFVIRRLWGKI